MHLPPAQPAGSIVPVLPDAPHRLFAAARRRGSPDADRGVGGDAPLRRHGFPFAHQLGVLRWLYRVGPPRCRAAVAECGQWLRALEAAWPDGAPRPLVDEARLRVERTGALLIAAGMERRVVRRLQDGMDGLG